MNSPADLHFERATLLLQQRRPADAERELRASLALEPSSARSHAVLALCLATQDRLAEASAEADQAVGLGPDQPFGHYVRGYVLYQRNRPDEAAPAAEQAVALDPYNADHWWLVGAIALNRRNWPAALAAAERGLEVDPEHAGCVNLRAMALVNLGRREEAGAAIGAALARDPDNAVTHANRGWGLLHEGKPTEAMGHFREALRLDPNLEWARAGIVESLKAKNVVYRLMLRYFLWTARLSSQAQWGITVGGFVGYQMLARVVADNPAAGLFVWPILVAYIAFALGTWLADPLFNLLLRTSKFGRLALSRRQTWASNVLGGLLLLAAAAVAVGLVTRSGMLGAAPPVLEGGIAQQAGWVDGFGWYALAMTFGLLTVPAMACFRLAPGWPTRAMVIGTIVLAAAGLSSSAGWFVADRLVAQADAEILASTKRMAQGLVELGTLPPEPAAAVDRLGDTMAVVRGLRQFFVVGFIASQFAFNYLRSVNPKK